MIILLAILVGALFATGTYLILQRTLTRIVLGLTTLSNGANMLMMLAGGRAGEPVFTDGSSPGRRLADPMPQAMALTAIVINFAMLAFLLTLAYRSMVLTGGDEVEDDLEDRRIALNERREELPEEIAEDLLEDH